MGRIYKQAKIVLVWLGPAADGSNLVFDVCNCEHQTEAERFKSGISDSYPDDSNGFLELRTLCAAKSLAAVFTRTYWSRLWIIQELCLAQDKIIFCGTRTTPWTKFHNVQKAKDPILNSHDEIPKNFSHTHALLSVSLGRGGRDGTASVDLFDLISKFQNAKCSDPRDKATGCLV